MPIYKPSELRQFLDQLGVHPKKGLSQNFLIDGNVLRKIVATAQVAPGDFVVEIGSGPGALTEQLIAAGARVLAIEKDPVFAKELERFNVEVFCDDILAFDLEKAVASRLAPGQKAKVIANLPYHLTTPIITQLVKKRDLFSLLVLMVQEEVARRFVAVPKTSAYGSITVFLNVYTHPSYAFTVSRRCFYPAPKVDSAVVAFSLHEPPTLDNEEAFFKMVRTAFSHRRKMLRGSLRELYPAQAIEHALLEMKKASSSRPEELALHEFLTLFRLLLPSVEEDRA